MKDSLNNSTANPLVILSLQYFCYPDAVGDAWGLTYEVNQRLAARGHTVHWVTCKPEESLPDRETVDGVEYHRIGVGFSKSVPKLFGEMRKRVNGILRESAIDVVHVHNPLIGFLAWFNPRLWGVPKVYHFHGAWLDEEKIDRESEGHGEGGSAIKFWVPLKARLCFIRLVEWHCYFWSRRIIVLSEYSKNRFLDYYPLKKSPLKIIPGGVDMDFFRPLDEKQGDSARRGKPYLTQDGRELLTVRRLEARMGLEILIHAVAEITRRRPELPFSLIIVGKGSLSGKLENLIRELGLENRVRLTGLASRDDLLGYYQSADLFILPTVAIEGFGLATVEALACGTPVMGTPVGGTVEILRNIDPRLIFEDATPKALADGIEKFLEDPESFQALKSRCRAEAVNRYAWESVVNEIEKVLAEA